jgi:hypothetical protein
MAQRLFREHIVQREQKGVGESVKLSGNGSHEGLILRRKSGIIFRNLKKGM